MSIDSSADVSAPGGTSRSLGSRSLGSSATVSAVTGASRRERKNNREKQRRLEVNIMFDRLMKMLQLPKDSKSDKVKVLNNAIETISGLRFEVECLRQQLRGQHVKGEPAPLPLRPAPVDQQIAE